MTKMIGDHINDLMLHATHNITEVPLNQYIRKVRQFFGLKQEWVAKLVGITGTQLSYYELGKKQLPKSDIECIKVLYGIEKKPEAVTPSELLKKCKTCQVEKTPNKFYTVPRPSGNGSYECLECKTCTKERSIRNRIDRDERHSEVASWMTPPSFSKAVNAS